MIGFDTISAIAGLLGFSAKELSRALLQRRAKTNDAKALELEASRGRQLAEYRRDNKIGLFLHQYYADSLSADVTPVVLHAPRNTLAPHLVSKYSHAAIDVPLGTTAEQCSLIGVEAFLPLRSGPVAHDPASRDLSSAEAATIIAALELRGLRVWDSPVYRLQRIDVVEGALVTAFSIDRFMRYRFTLGALFDELVDALVEANGQVETVLDRSAKMLPLRTRYLPQYSSFNKLDRIVCVGGPSVTIAMARAEPFNDFVILIQRRADDLSDGQGLFAVIPQGFHQPAIDPNAEVAISATVFREVFEELFGGLEAERDTRYLRPDWYFAQCEGLRWFREHDEYSLTATALSRNLADASYECAALLVVSDTGYWERFSGVMKTSWESKGVFPVSTKAANNVYNRLEDVISDPGWSGEALVSLCRALECLAERFPDRVDPQWQYRGPA